MLTEQAKCAICEKEFTRECKRGRRIVFCSDECRKKSTRMASNEYNKRRYFRDPDWRAHKRELNSASLKRKRAERKEKVLNELVEILRDAKTDSEIRAILEKYVRLKAELYN